MAGNWLPWSTVSSGPHPSTLYEEELIAKVNEAVKSVFQAHKQRYMDMKYMYLHKDACCISLTKPFFTSTGCMRHLKERNGKNSNATERD